MKPKQQASGINPANLQEVLDSAPNALTQGQRQWFTPGEYAAALFAPLAPSYADVVCDLQMGQGALLASAPSEHRLGVEIDVDCAVRPKGIAGRWAIVNADVVKFADLLDESGFQCDLFVLNPPFSLKWSKESLKFLGNSPSDYVAEAWHGQAGKWIDSSLATLMMALHFCTARGEGYMILNEATALRFLGTPEQPPLLDVRRHVWLWLSIPGSIFPGTDRDLKVAVLYFARDHFQNNPLHLTTEGTSPQEIEDLLTQTAKERYRYRSGIHVMSKAYATSSKTVGAFSNAADEWKARHAEKPDYNIWLGRDGVFRCYLTPFQRISGRIPKDVIKSLSSLDGQFPSSLVVQKATRNALLSAVHGKLWRVHPDVPAAIDRAVAEYNAVRAPFYPLPEIQRIGYVDESDTIECRMHGLGSFHKGVNYPIESKTIKVGRRGKRANFEGGKDVVEYTGEDLLITIRDADDIEHNFMHQPGMMLVDDKIPDQPVEVENLHDLSELAQYFKIPEVPDIASIYPERYLAALDRLEALEKACSEVTGSETICKRYQREDLARASMHPGVLLAWAAGLGKTWGAYFLPMLWDSKVNLIIAPESLHEQIMEEGIKRFGVTALPLMSQDDYYQDEAVQALYRHTMSPDAPAYDGPPIWRITSYTALGLNGADQWTPRLDSKGQQVEQRVREESRAAIPGWRPEFAVGIGAEKDGIRCVLAPTLARLVADLFKCVVVDEGVRMKSTDAYIAEGVRTMNPKYRAVLTATPIKNRLEDIFWLAHWVCGGTDEPSARFPYEGTNEARELFANEHQLMERNVTKEDHARRLGRPARFVKRTSQICNIHRLWKLLGPIVIRRRKEDVGEDIVPKIVIPVRVRAGSAQQAVYRYHLENPPKLNKKGEPMDLCGQIVTHLGLLRMAALCPDNPTLRDYGGGTAAASWTNFTTKNATAIAIAIERLNLGQQILISSPFQWCSKVLYERFKEAGVTVCLLDGNVTPHRRGMIAKQFKQHAYSVMIVGQKAMGEGHSFDCCPNLIRMSLDHAFDINDQVGDRVHRLTSKEDVRIWDLITENTVDERIHTGYQEKRDGSNLALDARLLEESTEEFNIAQLMQEALASFDPHAETIDEQTIEDEWPALCHKLRYAEARFREFWPRIVPVSEGKGKKASMMHVVDLNAALRALAQPSAKRTSRRQSFNETPEDSLQSLLDSLQGKSAPSADDLLDQLNQ